MENSYSNRNNELKWNISFNLYKTNVKNVLCEVEKIILYGDD